MNNHTIKLHGIEIPATEYASQGNAILGIRDSGKSYTATVIAEQLLDAGIPFIAFDPIGVWRFLKVPGKGKGYKIVVAGDDGDLPLTPESAPEIVRASMRENIPLVLDLYSMQLSKADWKKIVETCIRLLLYENKKCGLRHVFIEEAAEFCPQRVGSEQGRVYAEVEKLARMGGNASLGYTLINQRSEEVNKAVLELCDCLFLHRQKGRNSLTALGKWLDFADAASSKEIIKSLPMLGQGELWLWLPGSDAPKRVQVQEKNSFHPDRRNPNRPAASAALNVGEFVEKMRGSLQKHLDAAKQNDPEVLKRRIAELERGAKVHKPQVETKIVPVFTNAELELWRSVGREMVAKCQTVIGDTQAFMDRLAKLPSAAPQQPQRPAPIPRPASPKPVPTPDQDGALDGAQQKIIDTILMLKARELVPNRVMIARWMGIHPNGGRYGQNLARLRDSGYLEDCELTDVGMSCARATETGFQAAREVLDGAQRAIVDLMADGETFDRESLAAALGIHPNGGRYGQNLARLREMELIPERGPIKLTEAAFK